MAQSCHTNMNETWCTPMNKSWHTNESWSCRVHIQMCGPWFIHECERVMTHEWVMTLGRMRHIAHMNESRRVHIRMCETWFIHECEWVMTHRKMRHIANMNKPCRVHFRMCEPWFIHECEWVMTPGKMRHVAHMSESCTYRVHIRMCETWLITWHVTHSCVWHASFTCGTCRIRMCGMSQSYVWHDVFMCVTWLIRMCDMTHSYVRHDAFLCVTCFIHMSDITHSGKCRGQSAAVICGSSIRLADLFRMCDMTHWSVWYDSFRQVSRAVGCRDSFVGRRHPVQTQAGARDKTVWHDSLVCVRRDSFLRVTWLVCMCDMTQTQAGARDKTVWHDSLVCVARLVDMCEMTPSCVRHGSFICHGTHMNETWRVRTHMNICDMTHRFFWHDWFVCLHDSSVSATWLIYKCDITHL